MMLPALSHQARRVPDRPAARFPLGNDASQRYHVDAQGRPFFLHVDTVWSLPRTSDANIDLVIDDRAAKGFTGIAFEAPLSEYTKNGEDINDADHAPFTVVSPNWNWVMNPAYWAPIDRIVNRCKARGMVAIIWPAYWGYSGNGADGCMPQITAASNAQMTAFGQALAARYNQENVIYVLGGDWRGTLAERNKQSLIAEAIAAARPNTLFSAHPESSQEAWSFWSSYSWFKINCSYPYETESQTPTYAWSQTRQAWNRAPTRPVWMIEGKYENSAGSTLAMLRRQAYEGFLAGGCANFFGNNPVWHLKSPQWPESFPGSQEWQDHLNDTGTIEQGYFKAFIDSIEWWKRVPMDSTDNTLVNGSLGSGASHVTPAIASDGAAAWVYVAATGGANLSLDTNQLTGIAGNVRIRLMNPTNGGYSTVGTFAKTAAQAVATGGERLVVLDAA